MIKWTLFISLQACVKEANLLLLFNYILLCSLALNICFSRMITDINRLWQLITESHCKHKAEEMVLVIHLSKVVSVWERS